MFCCTGRAVGGAHSYNCETLAPKGTCANHKIIAHDAEGEERWCDFCGRDSNGNQIKRPAGGWGTPR